MELVLKGVRRKNRGATDRKEDKINKLKPVRSQATLKIQSWILKEMSACSSKGPGPGQQETRAKARELSPSGTPRTHT